MRAATLAVGLALLIAGSGCEAARNTAETEPVETLPEDMYFTFAPDVEQYACYRSSDGGYYGCCPLQDLEMYLNHEYTEQDFFEWTVVLGSNGCTEN